MRSISLILHPKRIPNRIPKPPDRLIDLIELRRGVRGAEEHGVSTHIVAALGAEPRAFHEQGAVLDDGLENLLFQFVEALLRVMGVFLVVDLQPMEHARHGRHPADDGLRQMTLARLHHDVAPFGVRHTDVDEPVKVAGVTPVFVQELEDDQLADAAGSLGADVGVGAVAFADLFRGGDPPDARARREDLGEGVGADHAAFGVHGQV